VETRKERAKFISEVEKGEYFAPSFVTLEEYARNHYLNYVEKELSPASFALYNSILENYIYDYLGDYRLDKLTTQIFEEYFKNLDNHNLSFSTNQKQLNLLKRLMNLAIENEIIKTNPLNKMKPITLVNKKGTVYSDEEIKTFLQLLNIEENHQMSLLLKLAVTTGMRKGEILGLEWKHIDFLNSTIAIKQSLSYTKQVGYHLREPKTNTSIRTISISSLLNRELYKHYKNKLSDKEKAKELWHNDFCFYVFSNDFGKPLYPTYPDRYYKRFCKRNKFKKIRFHDLRHTHVNYLMNQGATLNDVSKRLGHSSISVTVDIYGHLDRSRDQKIASYFDQLL